MKRGIIILAVLLALGFCSNQVSAPGDSKLGNIIKDARMELANSVTGERHFNI
jgi:hypothetical protein